MNIHHGPAIPARRAPAEYFTGGVWIEAIVEAPAPATLQAARVTFEPGARTAWHSHPLGQTLHVVSGTGRIQATGGPVREIRAGDSVWIPPGEKHWHGAGPDTAMCHIAMQERQDGVAAAWMEKVSDEDYAVPPA